MLLSIETAASGHVPRLPWDMITTAADIALLVDMRGLIGVVAVGNKALSRDIHRQDWLGKQWRETVTMQSRPVADSLLKAQPSDTSLGLRHVDHASDGGLTVPVIYTMLPLAQADGDGWVLLLGRDLRGMEFTDVLLHADPAAACAYAKALSGRGTDPETLCLDVLAPAARRLGILWSEDVCSFAEVTMGLGALHQIVRELAPPPRELDVGGDHGRRILLALAPGEQHSFGLSIVRQFFLRAGWRVSGGASMPASDALRLVRQEHFAIVGFSAASESRFSALAQVIREVRAASRNRALRVMVGGQHFVDSPGLVAAVGADMTARDGRHAALEAGRLWDASAAK